MDDLDDPTAEYQVPDVDRSISSILLSRGRFDRKSERPIMGILADR